MRRVESNQEYHHRMSVKVTLPIDSRSCQPKNDLKRVLLSSDYSILVLWSLKVIINVYT